MSDNNVHRGKYHGSTGGYYPIFLKNLLLTIITIGIYDAWATNNNRKYFISNIEFAKGRYNYHGTGLELFIGRLKALAIMVLIIAIYAGLLYLFKDDPALIWIPFVVLYAVLILLMPIVVVGIMRYRLSRTSWNNIRHNFSGNWRDLLPIYVKGFLLTLITIGIYSPWFTVNVYNYIFKNAWLGNKQYSFEGKGRVLFFIMLKGILQSIITLGIYSFWYYAEYLNFIYHNTSIDGKKYQFNAKGGEVFVLIVPNILIIIFSLGLAIPVAQNRAFLFFASHIAIDGSFDPASVQQGNVMNMDDATKEGLGSMLDLDI